MTNKLWYIDKDQMAVKLGFDLEGKETSRRRKIGKCRMNTRFFCITAWTTIPSIIIK